jgi:hypothetical protein
MFWRVAVPTGLRRWSGIVYSSEVTVLSDFVDGVDEVEHPLASVEGEVNGIDDLGYNGDETGVRSGFENYFMDLVRGEHGITST